MTGPGRTTVVALWLVVVAALPAAAAGLGGVQPTPLGAGATSVDPCDADGFDYTLQVDLGLVTAVVVSDIADPGCEGGTLDLTLVDDTDGVLSQGSAVVSADEDTDPNSLSVSLSVDVSLSSVAGIHAAVTGP